MVDDLIWLWALGIGQVKTAADKVLCLGRDIVVTSVRVGPAIRQRFYLFVNFFLCLGLERWYTREHRETENTVSK